MNMTEQFAIMDSFQAVHGWRYRYVNKSWWVWDGRQWSFLDARERLQRALAGIGLMVFPEDPKIQVQLQRDYIINTFSRMLVPRLRADTLLGDPTPREPESE